MLETALRTRGQPPRLSPWVTPQVLLALAPARFSQGDQDGVRELLTQPHAILKANPDAGTFANQLQKLERSLGRSSQRPAIFGDTLTDRELAVLRLLPSELTHRALSLIHISEPTRLRRISYAVFCLKKKKKKHPKQTTDH